MGILDWFFGKSSRREADPDLGQFPWDRHPSIFEYLGSQTRSDKVGIPDADVTLPDAESVAASSNIRWAPGARDGVATYHMGGVDSDAAASLVRLVTTYTKSPTARAKAKVYEFLVQNGAIPLIDPFLEGLREQADLNHQRLYELAKSFATQAPDREPVKFGIALLGLYGREEDREVFRTLGRHDEFTLFCAVALGNGYQDAEGDLWELAKSVKGWGRIHSVERLANTENPEIKEWLLREGYKNSIMYEYLAHPCAVGGDLLGALEPSHM